MNQTILKSRNTSYFAPSDSSVLPSKCVTSIRHFVYILVPVGDSVMTRFYDIKKKLKKNTPKVHKVVRVGDLFLKKEVRYAEHGIILNITRFLKGLVITYGSKNCL